MSADASTLHHDVFISYATVATGHLGAALEHGLATFGKSWDAPLAMDVFRDVSDQPTTPDLAAQLQRHLDAADWLVHLASPAAAASPWVREELRHWLRTRGTDRLLLGIADGDIVWDLGRARFDPGATTCLAPELLALPALPKWVDFRGAGAHALDATDEWFVDKVADFSATVRGIPKDQLSSTHWREHRKGLARRTAQHAEMLFESDVGRSLLFAAVASELDDVPETRNTLSRLLEASSGTAALAGPHGRVSTAAHGTDPATVVLAHEDGALGIRAIGDPARCVEAGTPRPGHAPTALAAHPAGPAVGYEDGVAGCVVQGQVRLVQALDQPVTMVHPDPELRRIACAARGTVAVWDVEANTLIHVPDRLIAVHGLRWEDGLLHICDWGEVRSFDPADGRLQDVHPVPFLPRPGPRALTPGMDVIAVAQLDGGGVTVTSLPETAFADVGSVQAPPGFMDALALDAHGEHVAVATGGELLVWSLARPAEPVLHQYGLPAGLRGLLLGENGAWVLCWGTDRCELRTDAPSTLCHRIPLGPAAVPSVVQSAISVAFSPDGREVAWVSNPVGRELDPAAPPSLSTWHVGRRELGAHRDVGHDLPSRLSFLDGDRVRLELRDGGWRTWHLRTNELGPGDPPAPARRTLHRDTTSVRVLEAGTVIDELSWPSSGVPRIHLSPSGTRLVLAFASGRLLVRDVESRTELWTVLTAALAAVACSHDDGLVAGVTAGGRLMLLEGSSGQVTASLRVPSSPVQRLVFAPADRALACGGVGGLLTLVDTDPPGWRGTARSRAGRELTPAETQLLGLEQVFLP